MRKFLQILSASVVGASMMAGIAAADPASCNISGTGPGSTNTCTSNTTDTVTVDCVNNIVVLNDNGQTVSSGAANGNSNTLAGNVTTGSAVNDNGTNFTLGASCGTPAATVATVTPTTPAATPAASTPAPAAPASANVASLPNTGSDTLLDATVLGVAGLGGVMAASRFGVMAYRRFALK